MKIELKDVLHLYIGCDCKIRPFDIEHDARFLGLIYPFVYVQTNGDHAPTKYRIDKVNFKPVLRSLSNMTEDEAVECGWKKVMTFKEFKDIKGCRPINQVISLIRLGFDLFELIESEQAIAKI